MTDVSFLLLRLGIGLSFFGHGLVRMPKLDKFASWMQSLYADSLLPVAWVQPFSFALPFIELGIGILLIVGLFTRASLIAGGVTMLMLIFGSTMIESWDALPSQLIHLAYFAVLIQPATLYNAYSIDNLRNR